jgi:hypothetical protein
MADYCAGALVAKSYRTLAERMDGWSAVLEGTRTVWRVQLNFLICRIFFSVLFSGTIFACGAGSESSSALITRSCDVMVTDAATITPVFASGVRGTVLRRGSALAISFVSTADEPFPSPAVRFTKSNDAEAEEPSPPISTCYDRLGVVIPGAKVTVSGL